MKCATTVWFAFLSVVLVVRKHSRERWMNEWIKREKKKIINKSLNKYHGHISMWFHCFNLLNMFTWFSPIVFILDSLFIVCAMQTGGNYVMCVCVCAMCAVQWERNFKLKKGTAETCSLILEPKKKEWERQLKEQDVLCYDRSGMWMIKAWHNIISVYNVDLVWIFLSVWRICTGK